MNTKDCLSDSMGSANNISTSLVIDTFANEIKSKIENLEHTNNKLAAENLQLKQQVEALLHMIRSIPDNFLKD